MVKTTKMRKNLNKKVKTMGIICSADDYFEALPGGYLASFDPPKLGSAHKQCLKKFTGFMVAEEEHGWGRGLPYIVYIMSGIPGSGKSWLASKLINESKWNIVVDNTNLSAWEISPYLNLALAYNHDVQILRVNTPLEICLERQTHGVPRKKMEEMLRRFNRKNVMPWWPIKEMDGI